MSDVGAQGQYRNPLHGVAIVGAFNTPQAKRLDGHTSASVTMLAIQGALADAGLSYRDVDGWSVTSTGLRPTETGYWVFAPPRLRP